MLNRLKSSISVKRILLIICFVIFVILLFNILANDNCEMAKMTTVNDEVVVYSFNTSNDGNNYYYECDDESLGDVAVLIRQNSKGEYVVNTTGDVSVITISADELSQKGDSHDGYLVADCWLHSFPGETSTTALVYYTQSGDSWVWSTAAHGYACTYLDEETSTNCLVLVW